MKITICGCGNGAHACAALLSRKGHAVNIYSPLSNEVQLFKTNYANNNGLTLQIGGGLSAQAGSEFNDYDQEQKLKLNEITDKPGEVIPDSAIIIIIVPAFAHGNMLRSIKDHVSVNSKIVILPSRGGIEFEVKSILPNAKVVAFQTLPWACRIKKFGSEINLSGVKNKIQAAAMPSDLSQEFFPELEELLGLKIERLKSILTLTLANVGQIFHPGIMYGLFKNDSTATFSEADVPLFYENVDENTAALLSGMSDEVRAVACALAKVNQDVESDKVLHVRDWLLGSYEGLIGDTSSLQKMFFTNGAYKGIKAPMKRLENNRYAPDFGARYIVEDIPYGLLVTRSMAEMVNVSTPLIDEVLRNIGNWVDYDYLGKLAEVKCLAAKSRLPEFYGIHSLENLCRV
jgi:hypothetical protein